MAPFFISQNGYSSCIKIAGIPILPPLITDERRTELSEEKAKAVKIEKRIKRKRTSIDSGVMTGSYIEHFKNSESLLSENPVCNDVSISDLTTNENIHHSDTFSSDNAISDNFLKSALEDSEFREFFYSAAERIFKDNKILNESKNHNSSVILSPNHIDRKPGGVTNKNEIINESSQVTVHPSKQNHIVDVEVSDGIIYTDAVENDTLKSFQEDASSTTLPSVDVENQPLDPPNRPVRRNSYTLDSPSPVLLEHMSKGKISKNQTSNNWIELSSKKEECESLGFKTFSSTKKQRKTWNKKEENHSVSPPSVGDFPDSKVPYCLPMKSKTFIRTDKHYEDSNYSLPCSSCSSPTHLSNFAYSSDCIHTNLEKTPNIKSKNFKLNLSNTFEFDNPIKMNQQQKNQSSCENTIMTVTEKDSSRISFKDSDNELKDSLSVKNDVLLHPNYSMSVLPPSQNMSKNSNIYACQSQHQTLVSQKISDCSTLVENRVFESKKEHLNEIDDTVSLCSSLSLSKFMPVDENVSRPSTAEDLSALFSELQLRHERQIAELLEMQHKEKVMLSQLHSNHGTISSQSTTNLSVSDLSFDHNNLFPASGSVEKRTLCSRELFPSENNGNPPKERNPTGDHYYTSESEKVAALKLTACVRGYLTRRLLKTEKVQQLIDTIKESLNCAFSLQSETELRKNDLELHERLAHQLTSALYELQSIISAPVASRMAIIATDREKLRKPVSRPSSAISTATQKAILRRQKSMNSSDKKSQDNNHKAQEIRPRAKSLCLLGTPGSGSNGKSESSTYSVNCSRKPWR